MNHADVDADAAEEHRDGFSDEARADERPVDRPVSLEEQYPGKRAHEHTDPQREQEARDGYGEGETAEPGQHVRGRVREHARDDRYVESEYQRIDEHATVDLARGNLAVCKEHAFRCGERQAQQLGQGRDEAPSEKDKQGREQRDCKPPVTGLERGRACAGAPPPAQSRRTVAPAPFPCPLKRRLPLEPAHHDAQRQNSWLFVRKVGYFGSLGPGQLGDYRSRRTPQPSAATREGDTSLYVSRRTDQSCQLRLNGQHNGVASGASPSTEPPSTVALVY